MQKGREWCFALLRCWRSARCRIQQISPFSGNKFMMMDSSSSERDRYTFSPTLRWNPDVELYFSAAYGADHFARISSSLTHPSSYSCIRVNTLMTTADAVVNKLTNLVREKLLQNSIQGMEIGATYKPDQIPWIGTSEEPSIAKCEYPGLDYVLFVKGTGPHMLQYKETPIKSIKEVIVSRKCAEAVLRGAQVYVPGVLACSAHVEKGDMVAVSAAVEQHQSDGGWAIGITRGIVLQGSEADPQYYQRNGLYIGKGITQMSRGGIFRAAEGVAIEMTNRVYELPSLNDVLEGEIFLQNLPSIVTAHVLDPQQGEKILDMCAAPGGKTTAIAMLMKDKGEVVAIDRSHNKVMEILKLAAEMGLSCIRAYKLDALKLVRRIHEILEQDRNKLDNDTPNLLCEDSGSGKSSKLEITCDAAKNCTDLEPSKPETNGKSSETLSNSKTHDREKWTMKARNLKNGPGKNQQAGGKVEISKGYEPNTFDRVLLDAPCSALGLRPRLFAGEETIDSLKNHAKYQRRMFDQAIQLVRPGGVIVYSTCTINPGENEALVRYALDKYKFLSLASQHPRIGGPGLVGHCELCDGQYVEQWLTHEEAELVQRFDPSSPLDTIGFFIAKFNVGEKNNL